MLTWLGRYGGYLLIFAGALVFSTVVPSAAGPPDALSGYPAPGPAVRPGTAPSGGAGGGPLLIGSPRRGLLGSTRPGPPTAPTPPAAAPAATASAVPSPSAAPSEGPMVAGVAAKPAAGDQATLDIPLPPPPLPSTDRIVIPRVGVDTKVIDVGVLPNGEMETAAHAAGRLAYSAEAGERGNAVIAGHNDTLGEVFRRLPEVKVGDEVLLYRGEHVFRYVVERRTIVREEGATPAQRRENAQWLEPTDEATCTLVSCYPYRVDTHRVIVRARLVE